MLMTRTLAMSIALPALAALSVLASPAAYADAPTHEIRKTEPKVAAGGHASASLTIAAKNGWHVNAEAPITVSLKSSDAGLTVAKEKLTRADLAESTKDAARFDIALTCAAGAAAGPKTINAEAKFVMCQESACKPVKETLALAIEVTPANAPIAAKKSGKAKTK
jgi:uncharacterized protein YyaL (SSP411 family)